ncbi:MAG TPA: hypothetical protein VN131_06310 [Mobilitalea sp.]|nr:hypothetical protein [Mobilitalea sp.]
MNEIEDDIIAINQVKENDDLMLIENLAHNIKVLANDIDAEEIKDTAFKIELAARRGILAKAINYIEHIKYEVNQLRVSQ